MVVGGRTGDQVSDSRVSLTAWLDDGRHPAVAAASRRVAAITGLSTTIDGGDAEQFQVRSWVRRRQTWEEEAVVTEAVLLGCGWWEVVLMMTCVVLSDVSWGLCDGLHAFVCYMLDTLGLNCGVVSRKSIVRVIQSVIQMELKSVMILFPDNL